MELHPSRRRILPLFVTIVLSGLLVSGCILDISTYTHPHVTSSGEEITVTITIDFDTSTSGNETYALLAVLLPDSWILLNGSYSGDHSGSMSPSSEGELFFESRHPSGEGYSWAALISDASLVPAPSITSCTFTLSLIVGNKGVYALDYRIASVETPTSMESGSRVSHIGNVFVSSGSVLPHSNLTYVPRVLNPPTFGAFDGSWAGAAHTYVAPGAGGRFASHAFFIADQTHLNVFVDAVGMGMANEGDDFLVLAFDSNNDGLLTHSVDTAIRLDTSSSTYSLVRYDGEYDLLRWGDIQMSLPFSVPHLIGGLPMDADAMFIATDLSATPHWTFFLRLPLGSGLFDIQSSSVRYAMILYSDYIDYSVYDSNYYLYAYDTRSYHPDSADAYYMPSWGFLTIAPPTPPTNTWGTSLVLSADALDDAHQMWLCITPHLCHLAQDERESLAVISAHMADASCLTSPFLVTTHARSAITLMCALIEQYGLPCTCS